MIKYVKIDRPKKNECWYGIVPLRFIWHGEWAAPEIVYKGQLFNANDVKDVMWDWFCEDYPDAEIQQNEDAFINYVVRNADEAKEILNNIITYRKEKGIRKPANLPKYKLVEVTE